MRMIDHFIQNSTNLGNDLRSFETDLSDKPLSSTYPSVPHTLQFNTPLSQNLCWTEEFLEWNWGGFGVKLRGFECGTQKGLNWGVFGVELRGRWNWGVFGVELRILGAEKVSPLCGTDVLNLGGLWGTEGYSF